MVLSAPLPPSWNAHRRALRALGLELDAVDCYGLGGGLGLLYGGAPGAGCLVGYGSLDPVEELAIAVGAWVDQKHSASREAAAAEMRDHLARESTPVIAPQALGPELASSSAPASAPAPASSLSPEPEPELEISAALDLSLAPAVRCTFASLVELGERAVFRAGSSDSLRELPAAAFLARLPGDGRRWAVIISNGRFTAVRARVRAALRRSAHRMAAGWRGHPGGLAALDAFRAALAAPAALDPAPTLAASAQLGGGMGRALFSAFLERHAEHLPAPAARLPAHFRELDAAWREAERILAEGARPGASLLQRIADGEAAGAAQLREQLG